MSRPGLDALARALDDNTDAIPGARLRFRVAGTSTPAAVYSGPDLETTLGSELIADAAGAFPQFWFSFLQEYDAVLDDGAGGAAKMFAKISAGGLSGDVPISAPIAPLLNGSIAALHNALSRTVNVQHYGALGDDAANDTLALASAIAAAHTLAARVVYIPPGRYRVEPLTVTNPTVFVFAPGAVLVQRSAFTGRHGLLNFADTAAGSGILNGDFDGRRSALVGSFPTPHVDHDWMAWKADCARFTVVHARVQNFATWAFWHGGDKPDYDGIHIYNCGKAGIVQFFEDGRINNIHVADCSNQELEIYQHLWEFRELTRVSIDGLTCTGWAPTNDGLEPYPICYTFNRLHDCTVENYTHDDYQGENRKNGGTLVSYATRCQFSKPKMFDVAVGFEATTCYDCTLTDPLFDGEFCTPGGFDTVGLWLRYAGQIQVDFNDSQRDTLLLSSTSGFSVVGGSATRFDTGFICSASNVDVANFSTDGNRQYGRILRGASDNDWFPGMDLSNVRNYRDIGGSSRHNGLSGVAIRGAEDYYIDIEMSNNGQNSGAATNLRSGVLLLGDEPGGVGAGYIAGRAIDNQDWTETDDISFIPQASDADDQVTVTALDPDRFAVGQNIVLKLNAGDLTGKIVSRVHDDLVLQLAAPASLAASGNTSALTGTVTTLGHALEGSGTAFETEIKGRVWLQIGGQYTQVQRVTDNNTLVIAPPLDVEASGAGAAIVSIDVEGVPSQQTGVYMDGAVTGPLKLDVQARGNVLRRVRPVMGAFEEGQELVLESGVVNLNTSGVVTDLISGIPAGWRVISYRSEITTTIAGIDSGTTAWYLRVADAGSSLLELLTGPSTTVAAGTKAHGPAAYEVQTVTSKIDFLLDGGSDAIPSGGAVRADVFVRKEMLEAF